MYPPILVRWMMQYYLKTVKIISSDTHIVPYSRYLVRTNNNNIVLHILMPDKKSGIKKLIGRSVWRSLSYKSIGMLWAIKYYIRNFSQ